MNKPNLLRSLKPLAIILLVLFTLQQFAQTVALSNNDNEGNQTDYMALLAIKSRLIDGPSGFLSSWNHSIPHCSWKGVTCDLTSQRVNDLLISGTISGGTISPFIGNLTFLTRIAFQYTSLHGQIPPEIGRLFRLQSIYLLYNNLTGEIPANISGCINLQILSLAGNKLQGDIPMALGTMPNLKQLFLFTNKLTGPLFKVIANLTSLEIIYVSENAFIGIIPDSISVMRNLWSVELDSNKFSGILPPTISNLSNLQELSLGNNQLLGKLPMGLGTIRGLKTLSLDSNKFSGPLFVALANLTSLETINCNFNAFTGSIPESISSMTNLISLFLTKNKISGMITPSIFNISSLQHILLAYNQLSGNIPSYSLFTILNLRSLVLANNNFYGSIPISLLNFTTLELFEVESNRFTGTIQLNFGQFYNLKRLQIAHNNFVGDISLINTLMNCSKLEVLDLSGNHFTGTMPVTIANLSTTLTGLYIGRNSISGEIPLGISNLRNLERLGMEASGLMGTIPQELGKLQKLVLLYIHTNILTGQIPDSFGNLSHLSSLLLNDNKLEGKIPPSLGSCASLLELNLSKNAFNGSLPFELFGGSKFVKLYLSHNQLEGILPLEISKQLNLIEFDVSANELSGKIPGSFGSLVSLRYLDMHDNFFHGFIPQSFTTLKSLQTVDLSQNNLSGPLPEYFSEFPLIFLNLSYNDFEGRVPTNGVFANASAISLIGNSRLCGGISVLHLPRCINKERQNKLLKMGVPIICSVIAILALAALIWLYLTAWSEDSRSIMSAFHMEESFMKVSYKTLDEATDGFSVRNQLGSGSFGSVFKGILDENTIAVKVFNLNIRGGSKSFMAECEVLRNIRHRNLVRILTACSSMDFKGNEFKALVYEFMPNGSLDGWLHGGRDFNLLQRLEIAIHVAHALNYLHHECENPIVHCDLKPSNILLDGDLVAHVGDFGLVKVLGQHLHINQSRSIGVKGTIGYIAPEYGLGGEISAAADLSSYGVLLLELITRKRPTDDMFNEDRNLHMYAKAALPDQVLQIVDSALLVNEDEDAEVTGQRIIQILQSMVRIGVACSNALPHERMTLRAVIRELNQAKNTLLSIQSTDMNIRKEVAI